MTRPEIIRADTIDLQDHEAPSAKGHPPGPSPTSKGSLAPHQAETIREVAAETAEENLRSPGAVWMGGEVGDLHQYADNLVAAVNNSVNGHPGASDGATTNMQAGQPRDALAIAQNGGDSGADVSDGDLSGDGDDSMDDDMMDKISSSPSIEDGGFPSSSEPFWPRRIDSLHPRSFAFPSTASDARSPSPYLEHPEPLDLLTSPEREGKAIFDSPCRHHHLSAGEYNIQDRPIFDSEPEESPVHEKRSRMSVLEEVVAEMFRQEQEAMHVGGQVLAELGATGIADSPSYQEPAHGEEVVDEGIAGMGYEASGDTQFGRLITRYDNPDDFDDLTLPYEGSDEDDDGDFSDVEPSFIDYGWDAECLQNVEDIDFEFVYALHTFVATVEGQANATKGDTMVLLDDSNSYWWLVRVVKDSSIGYLPAEHIETPTERLARLNKHRNIDLSATMLGDQAEKTRNPLKSAMKRRKAKTVTFTAPTYVDYSDFDYSTDEEDLEAEFLAQQQQQAQQSNAQQASAEPAIEDETARVEPLKPKPQQKEAVAADAQTAEANGDAATASAKAIARNSEEIFETKSGDGPKKTSDGTVRDSFFKDDTVETKKITLTPNLLRDDTGPRSSSDSKELKQRASLDKLEKDNPVSKDDKKKKDKKEKEKKPGGIRSFFSRKEKKRSVDEDDDSFGKRSMDANEKEVELEEPAAASPEKSEGPQRHPSKLKKQQPRIEPTLSSKGTATQPKESGMDLASFLSTEGKGKNTADVPPASMRMVEPDLDDFNSSPEGSPKKPSRDRSPETSRKGGQPAQPNVSAFRGQNGNIRPQQVVQAKARAVLDDSDSDQEVAVAPAPAPAPAAAPVRPAPVPEEVKKQQQEQQRSAQQPILPGTYPDSYLSTQTTASDQTERAMNGMPQQQHQERLSESPVQVSPVTSNNPPPLMIDTSSQEEDHSSMRSSPELIDREDGDMHGKQDSITTSTSATTTSTWNDASLRAFFDSGSDVRDLLVVVYDKTDVVPAGPEHPIAGTLFKEQNAKLAEITTQLDNMLGDWLARKQRLRNTV
ncbi:hypothetical protein CONLIGDRAFT_652103 [Coniochaeta ligniaria NRRL 30616]|uniref:SH3 domain-containing protein n=1 Tax=Coniochaeta ligniaria NRRL 30616 TaxID=1408157 RepID=A0A1J7J198_9PEZI|nr:hypothetical protein CONLIGDRAFT_652103 [Coniochaeta ligniaria NRRL 30616]